MNKFLNILSVALLSCLIISNTHSIELTLAINRLDVKEVEKLLEAKVSISQEHKNKLLEIAKKSAKNYGEATTSLLKSKKDILRLTLGSASTLAGSLSLLLAASGFVTVLIGECPKKDVKFTKNGCIVATICSVPLLAVGITQIYRGWKLRSAFTNLQKAQEIKTLIQNCPVKNNQIY